MPFWIFKKKEAVGEDITLPVEDFKEKLEQDLQFLIDYFHEIARELSKIEHNANVSEVEIGKITKLDNDFKRMIQRLNKNVPEYIAHWNTLGNLCEDFVYDVKKILPNAIYQIPLDQKRLEELGRVSRRNASNFVGMLEDVKKKLNKTYRREFKIGWPKRTGFH